MNQSIYNFIIEKERSYLSMRAMMDALNPLDLLKDEEAIPLSHAREFTRYPKLPEDLEGIEHTAKFNLAYPFSKGIEKTVKFTSVKDIAIAVLDGFEEMFNASKLKDSVPGMLNKHYSGPYGEAYHSIEDLWIEGINYDPKNSFLFISLGS